MSEQTPTGQPATPKNGVPPELIHQLHEANEQFHRAGEHLDEANSALVNGLEERARAAREVVQAANTFEELDEKIAKELSKTQ